MTKSEKKILKASKKLEKATKKYMEELDKIDRVFQNLPTKYSRLYHLEDRYFKIISPVLSNCVKLELLHSYLSNEIIDELEEDINWNSFRCNKK
jgi:hypothetical protein